MGVRIAFTGKAGTGKSTAAEHLIRNKQFVHLSFAAKLKQISKDLWPEAFADCGKPRKLLQDFGSKVRDIDEDTWAKYAMRKVAAQPDDSYVVDDLRYLNEAAVLKQNGFVIVRITGPCRISMPPGTESHQSETEMQRIEVDYTITNDGTIEDLDKKVEQVVNGIAKHRPKGANA